MKLLTLPALLKLFEHKNSRTFTEFLKNAQVKSGTRIVPLKQYMKLHDIDSDDIRLLYHHIINRKEYLTRFFNTSLQVEQMHIHEKPMPKSHIDNNQLVKYKNIIRNIHFRNILQKTTSGLDNVPSFLDVLIDLYKKEIIDYKIITPSAIHYIQSGRIGSVFSSFYFRASIMNPYVVYSLQHNILKGSHIFTPTLGWSSYAYGFLECPYIKEYVGVDVIHDVCKKTADLISYYPHIKTEIICKPSEDLLLDIVFMKRYNRHFDTIFFSPPYYELEMYPGENQSTHRYTTFETWLSGYWRKTIELCYHVLTPNGKLCYILSSGGGKSQIDILDHMNTITKEYFIFDISIPMYNKNVHITSGSHRETKETILVFTKKQIKNTMYNGKEK
jgi:hypothetical protein